MIDPFPVVLWYVPTRQEIDAAIVLLTPELIDQGMQASWWDEDCLDVARADGEIDRHWDWHAMAIEHDGDILRSAGMAVITPDNAVQGAMLISTQEIDSQGGRGKKALKLELLFTAPRNRPQVRKDKQPILRGVGVELLRWGAILSRELGCGGRIRLDSSPDFIRWYENRGLKRLRLKTILFEDVFYAPMELSEQAAEQLING